MSDLKQVLTQLHNKLTILRERQAKRAGNLAGQPAAARPGRMRPNKGQ